MQGGPRIETPTSAELSRALLRLNGRTCTFACLERQDGSGYMQVGGGPTEFTVEVRRTEANGSFTHWKAARPGTGGDAGVRHLHIGGQVVTVQACETLSYHTVSQLFGEFGRAATGREPYTGQGAHHPGSSKMHCQVSEE